MSSKNPVREVLQNLANEFEAINTNCIHFDVTINALIIERTKNENNKPLRRFCRCLRLVDALKPETSTFYKDKSSRILEMLRHVRVHYDDLKRRYFWALDRLAEMTMKLNRLAEYQLMTEARNKYLGKSWKDFCGYKGEEKKSPSTKSKGIKDVDKLLGLEIIGDVNKAPKTDKQTESSTTSQGEKTSSQTNQKDKRKHSYGVCTKVTKSPKFIEIEDFPVDTCESGDLLKSNTGISKIASKFRRYMKNGKSDTAKVIQELANTSEIKMQIYALMAEVSERDELIDSLISQMKNKDAQITQLVNIIQYEKLGLETNAHDKQAQGSDNLQN